MGHADALMLHHALDQMFIILSFSLLFAIYAASSFRSASSFQIIEQITMVVWTSDSHVDILIKIQIYNNSHITSWFTIV